MRSRNYGALMGLTQALTGTALAARTEDDSRLHGDVAMTGYLKGCVRGRTLRLGKATPLFDGALGATGFAVCEESLKTGGGLRLVKPRDWPPKFRTTKTTGGLDLPDASQGTDFHW
jgi:hypothetical protein